MLYRKPICSIILSFALNPLHAANDLIFKKETLTSFHSYSYFMVLGVLILLLFFLTKTKKGASPKGQCQIIEQRTLRHKTTIYIIAYQNQHFLIADNQHALTIHPVSHEVSASL